LFQELLTAKRATKIGVACPSYMIGPGVCCGVTLEGWYIPPLLTHRFPESNRTPPPQKKIKGIERVWEKGPQCGAAGWVGGGWFLDWEEEAA